MGLCFLIECLVLCVKTICVWIVSTVCFDLMLGALCADSVFRLNALCVDSVFGLNALCAECVFWTVCFD